MILVSFFILKFRRKHMKSKEITEMANETIDRETKSFTSLMCSKCKFYINNMCSKKRIIRECAKKGLKNKE